MGRCRKPTQPIPAPPRLGTPAVIQHGFYQVACQVIQVTQGRYVKVWTLDKRYFVFTRQDDGSYLRRRTGLAPWKLVLSTNDEAKPRNGVEISHG